MVRKISSPPVDRCPTLIPGFDNLCAGGLVRNNTYVINGGPGAGKTVFMLQFLWNGLSIEENGLYISFESDLFDLMQDAYTMGWDFSKSDQEGKCKFLRVDPNTNPKELAKQLMEVISKFEIKRVCIDPLSVYVMSMPDQSKARKIIYELTSLLKRMKVTVLVSMETFGDGISSLSSEQNNIIDFLSDGVLELHSAGIGGEADRAVRIVKMRRTNHIREPTPMKITSQGIQVLE